MRLFCDFCTGSPQEGEGLGVRFKLIPPPQSPLLRKEEEAWEIKCDNNVTLTSKMISSYNHSPEFQKIRTGI